MTAAREVLLTFRRSLLALLLITATVTGCGGGGSNPPPTAPPSGLSESEPNDFSAQSVGTLSGSDIRVNGSTTNVRDVDLFRVTTAAPLNLFVNLDWNSASDLELTISNANGIFVREVDTASHPETCRLDGLPAGTYTVRVGSFTNAATSYTLTLGSR
jgi:hypothetical protein